MTSLDSCSVSRAVSWGAMSQMWTLPFSDQDATNVLVSVTWGQIWNMGGWEKIAFLWGGRIFYFNLYIPLNIAKVKCKNEACQQKNIWFSQIYFRNSLLIKGMNTVNLSHYDSNPRWTKFLSQVNRGIWPYPDTIDSTGVVNLSGF